MKKNLRSVFVQLFLVLLVPGFVLGQQSENILKLSSQNKVLQQDFRHHQSSPKAFNWFEGFDSGALPDGWQNVVNEGNGWDFATSPFTHTFIYYFGDLQRNAMLVTPLLDLSGLETVTLGINHRIYAYGTGWSQKIMISNDGVNWEVIQEYTEGFVPDDYQYDEFDITPSKAGEQVYLAFAVDYPLLQDYYEVVWEIKDVSVFEPVPTFNVSFAVEDEGGNPLNDAIVTLDGNTNAAGDYLFEDIEPGTYDYSVELDGYITAEGQVEVVDQDVVENVVLTQPVIITEFPWFEGFDGGALPDGWQNVVNEGNGFDFATSPFTHTFIYYFGDLQRNALLVTPLLDLSGLETVKFGINHRIYAYGTGWSHKIMISNDGVNWDVIQEYTEGFNPDDYQYDEFDITPSKAGEQVYLALAVDYPLLQDYYEVVWEIKDVSVFEPVPTFNVSFAVEDEGGNPLNDAIVTLDGNTNAAGDYLFEDIEPGTYDYSVELDGYITAEGQVEVVDQDVVENVVLTQPVIITEFPWFEGFDSGALPDGWQNVVNEGNGWDFATSPFTHTFIYYFGDLQRNAMLVTPLLDLSGLETVTLGINHRIYAYGTGWSQKIMISNDGVNWEVIQEYTEGFVPDDYQYDEFDITPSKAGEQVYLALAVDYPMLQDYYEVVWEIKDVSVFEPVPTFNVSFAVEDEGGNPLNDAIVTLDGNTNAAGNYLFEDIEPGTYDYSVELDGYITAEGQVEVVDQDVVENVVLQEDGQHIALLEGWSLISSYQNIENPDLMEVFEGHTENMIIMINKTGIFWPGYNINTIGDWNSYEGYKIKMQSEDMLVVPGEMVENRTIELEAGVSYLPVLSDVPVDAEALFSPVSENLRFAFDLVSGTIYWPDGGIYSLETLQPGVAYLVSMTTPGTISFEGMDNATTGKQPVSTKQACQSGITNTGIVHLVSVSADALAQNFSQGSWIGAYNSQGICAGKSQYIQTGKNIGLVVYGDDPTTDETDGLTEGESMILKQTDAFTGETFIIQPEWNTEMQDRGNFAENGLSAITSFKTEATSIGENQPVSLSVYPNPAQDMIRVSVKNLTNGQIEMLNHMGQKVMMTEISATDNKIDVSALTPGVYFVRLLSGDTVLHIEKIIVK